MPKGFALLLTIVITSIIGLLAVGWWQRSTLTFDIVSSRKNYYKNLYLTEATFFYGITIVKKYFDDFLKPEVVHQMPITMDLSFILKLLVLENGSDLSISFVVKKDKNFNYGKNSLFLVASLFNRSKLVCSLRCRLVKYDKYFVVEHYTLGTAV